MAASQNRRPVAVALFEREVEAREAARALEPLTGDNARVSVLDSTAADLPSSLVDLGVPDGESRFYGERVQAGLKLVVAAGLDYERARDVLLSHGGTDVQSQGGDLARDSNAGTSSGSVPRPIDVTGRWDDVSSRYEMLFGQHYGTSDATWEQMAPVYRFGWEIANEPGLRGRRWADVESEVRSRWEARSSSHPWESVAGPVRDVWEDVAAEATTGAEGGQDRRIPRQGTDQSVAARDLLPPQPDVP